MSIVAPAISAFGPLHRRQAPPPGRQRTTRRQSRSLSGPLRAFQTRGCTSGHPPEFRKVPVSAGSQRRWLRAVRHTGSAWTRNRRHPRAVVGLLFRPDDRCLTRRPLPAGPPVEFTAAAAAEHRRAGDLGIRPPPPPSGTAAWPSADHSASELVSQRPLRAFQPPGGPQGTPRNSVKCPSTPVPGAAGPTRFATPAPAP